MNLRRSDDDNDYLFAGTPNADDSFVKACGITTQRTSTLPCDKKEKTVSAGDSRAARGTVAEGHSKKLAGGFLTPNARTLTDSWKLWEQVALVSCLEPNRTASETDGQVVTRRYISKRWKKPIAFSGHEARAIRHRRVSTYTRFHNYGGKLNFRSYAQKLKKFYRIAYPYLNVIDPNSELAVNCNCTFGHITVQFGDTVKHMHFVHKTELLTLLPTTTCLSHTFVVEFSIRARGFLSMQNMPKVSQILQQYNFHRKRNSSYPLRKPVRHHYTCEKYGDFPIEEIQFKITKLKRPSELNRDRKYCNLKSRSPLKAFTFVNVFTTFRASELFIGIVYVKFYAHINETCHCHNGRQSIQRVNDNGSQNRVKLLEFTSTSSESRYQTD
ncbi:hypothetical protein ALC57_02262 [Trachymyrmex cornetzi]|uniref:Uncharacterized protein n=1 Tax=Trachymyrmex cornetzi TaxID=471704 RepID=A0A195EJW3_9HYME|nr:hypothetical protein ALC57_02262 [Trachymyrmex cornetzi]